MVSILHHGCGPRNRQRREGSGQVEWNRELAGLAGDQSWSWPDPARVGNGHGLEGASGNDRQRQRHQGRANRASEPGPGTECASV